MEPAPARKDTTSALLLLVVAVVAIASAGWFFRQWWAARPVANTTPPPAVQHLPGPARQPVAQAVVAAKPAPAAPPISKPAPVVVPAPPVAQTPPVAVAAAPAVPVTLDDSRVVWPADLKLSAIFFSSSHSKVILNGSVYGVGDSLQGITIKEVGKSTVIVEWNGHRKELMMDGQ
jgi:hypothetical protein